MMAAALRACGSSSAVVRVRVCRSSSRDWAKLNDDVLESISDRLSMVDYIRVQAVCKSWQLVLKGRPFRHHPHSQFPWLAVPDDTSDICKFYNLTENKFYHIYLPELRDSLCVGSSFGWMVIVDNHLNAFLLNPLTRSRIELPSITTFPEVMGVYVTEEDGTPYFQMQNLPVYPGDYHKGDFFHKVILSENPSLTRDYTAMAIYGKRYGLAFCKQGDCKWTIVEGGYYVDIIYWRQQFYALATRLELVVCDLQGAVCKVITLGPRLNGGTTFYLVVSQDDQLLLVGRKRSGPVCTRRWIDEEDVSQVNQALYEQGYYGIDQHKTDSFRLLKFDEENLSWVWITTFEDYATLFVGLNFGFGLSFGIIKSPEYKTNNIYFTDDCLKGRNAYMLGTARILVVGHDLGCYDLKTGKIEVFPCFPDFTWTIWPPPFWIALSPY